MIVLGAGEPDFDTPDHMELQAAIEAPRFATYSFPASSERIPAGLPMRWAGNG